MKLITCYVIYEVQDIDTSADSFGSWFLTYRQFFGEDEAVKFLDGDVDVADARKHGKTVIGPLRHV